MILLTKLILAHLLGDFVLQPDSWVREKEQKKYRSEKLYLHGVIHFVLILIITWDGSLLLPAFLIALSHILIDTAKLQFQNHKNRRLAFVTDQLLHVAVLIIVALLIEKPSFIMDETWSRPLVAIVTGVIFLLRPSSVIIKLVLSKWTPATEFKSDKIETPSLLHAGMMIGYLERMLVFIFILVGQWAAIGFLVTAKSVFRFSDLKIGQDRKLTEYILIGTLLSFGIAIVTGIMVNLLMQTL